MKTAVMNRVTILCLRSSTPRIVRLLQRAGTVQIQTSQAVEENFAERADVPSEAEDISQALITLKGFQSIMTKRPAHDKFESVALAELLAESAKLSKTLSILEEKKDSLEEIEAELDDTPKKMKEKIAELQERKKAVLLEIDRISGIHYPRLAALVEMLQIEYDQRAIFINFGKTEHISLIEGWVPKKELAGLRESLSRIGNVVVREMEMDETTVPTSLENVETVKPFEVLINLLGSPKYGGIDPTVFVAITFPIFYGLMLGDIGYGLILLAGCLFLYFKTDNKVAKDFAIVLGISSLWSILFGALFGEIFGTFGHDVLGFEPLWIDRIAGVSTLLPLAGAIGFIHINSGYIIGFFQKLSEGHVKHAIFGKLSWLILQAGIILLVLSLIKYLPFSYLVGAAVAVAGVVMLGIGEGIGGLLRDISLPSGIMSYFRLIAIGLSSAGMALAVNRLVGIIINSMGYLIGIPVAIVVALAGHGINMALGIFGPFIHAARLHYVEFFTKFYDSGGRRFSPFEEKRKLTKENGTEE